MSKNQSFKDYDVPMTEWITKLSMVEDAQPQWVKAIREAQVNSSLYAVGQPKAPEITSQLLEQAAERLETDGWVQGAFHRQGGHCAIGALGAETVNFMSLPKVYSWGHPLAKTRHGWMRELMTLMGIARDPWNDITEWNDHPGRTKEEVIDALMLAAKKLRDMGR